MLAALAAIVLAVARPGIPDLDDCTPIADYRPSDKPTCVLIPVNRQE